MFGLCYPILFFIFSDSQYILNRFKEFKEHYPWKFDWLISIHLWGLLMKEIRMHTQLWDIQMITCFLLNSGRGFHILSTWPTSLCSHSYESIAGSCHSTGEGDTASASFCCLSLTSLSICSQLTLRVWFPRTVVSQPFGLMLRKRDRDEGILFSQTEEVCDLKNIKSIVTADGSVVERHCQDSTVHSHFVTKAGS